MAPVPSGKEEVDELTRISKEHAGARFRLADLQLHTPKDKRFKTGGPVETEPQRKTFAQSYVDGAVKAGLEVIAITEHNDVSWIEELREAANNAGLLLFPGFEVASADGVHVLGLFEPAESVQHLDEVLVKLGLTSEKRFHNDGSPRLSEPSLVDLIDAIHDERGLCILAHVDSEDGVLNRLKGEARVNAWVKSEAWAVQCSQDPSAMPEGFERRALTNAKSSSSTIAHVLTRASRPPMREAWPRSDRSPHTSR